MPQDYTPEWALSQRFTFEREHLSDEAKKKACFYPTPTGWDEEHRIWALCREQAKAAWNTMENQYEMEKRRAPYANTGRQAWNMLYGALSPLKWKPSREPDVIYVAPPAAPKKRKRDSGPIPDAARNRLRAMQINLENRMNEAKEADKRRAIGLMEAEFYGNDAQDAELFDRIEADRGRLLVAYSDSEGEGDEEIDLACDEEMIPDTPPPPPPPLEKKARSLFSRPSLDAMWTENEAGEVLSARVDLEDLRETRDRCKAIRLASQQRLRDVRDAISRQKFTIDKCANKNWKSAVHEGQCDRLTELQSDEEATLIEYRAAVADEEMAERALKEAVETSN